MLLTQYWQLISSKSTDTVLLGPMTFRKTFHVCYVKSVLFRCSEINEGLFNDKYLVQLVLYFLFSVHGLMMTVKMKI